MVGAYLNPGDDFGRYRIVRWIGTGAMGVVYAAVDRGLKRDVALKLLLPHLAATDEHRRRFLREAEALARLDSPHVIRVYHADEHQGWLYIVTQLVQEGDLRSLLNATGPLSIRTAAALTAQVAEGLAVAHEAGVLHLDIKPSNVLVRADRDGRPLAMLCDFGISTMTGIEHTVTVGVVGTYAYLAPERHDGKDASEASDVYALGCLLWTMLTGSAPYLGTDMQVAKAHMKKPIPQLEADGPLTKHANRVLARAMAKRPKHRYATASDFRHALEAVVAEGPPPVEVSATE